MKAAAESYRHTTKNHRSAKLQLISEARLNWHPSLRGALWEKIPVYIVDRLSTPYPPLDHHIAELPAIHKMWYKHLAFGKQPDKRLRRHPIVDLDPAKLVIDIGPTESACFKTRSGEIVGLVLRGFCASRSATTFADSVAGSQLPNRRNVRVSSISLMVLKYLHTNAPLFQKEDTGKLVQMGWSAGSRSRPHFDWVRNITATRLSQHEVDVLDAEASSLFALTWQMMRSLLPPEVVADFNNFVKGTGIPRMDGNGQLASGTYQVSMDGERFDFRDVELAPPGGVICRNYSRWAFFTSAYCLL